MKLVRYDVRYKISMFVCPNCEHTVILKRRIMRRCGACGYTDLSRSKIEYKWLTRPAGYSRLFPPEDADRVKNSLTKARKQGVQFATRHTFAGLRVTVLSLP